MFGSGDGQEEGHGLAETYAPDEGTRTAHDESVLGEGLRLVREWLTSLLSVRRR